MRTPNSIAKVAVFLALILTGCAAPPVQYSGKTVSPDQAISFTGAENGARLWQTGELQLRYSVADRGSSYEVTGTITPADSISYTFPSVDTLNLYGYLLDRNRKIVDRYSADITYVRYTRLPDKWPFRLQLPKREGADAFAFGYSGVFTNRSARPMRSLDREDKSISFRPYGEP